MMFVNRLVYCIKGQSLVEYSLIISVVALIIMISLHAFGSGLLDNMVNSGKKIIDVISF